MIKMRSAASGTGIVLLTAAVAIGSLTRALAGGTAPPLPAPVHYSGLLNDYTPSAAVVKGGPYEVRGKWTLDVDLRHGTARFAAALNMETSDYGIDQGTVNKDDPTTRGAHTHHISVTDGVIGDTWQTSCPTFSPAVSRGFVVTGTAFVTGNGTSAPFGNPSPLTICVLGADKVGYSNITITFGAPANTHFGKQAIHGVVASCNGPFGPFPSLECTVQD